MQSRRVTMSDVARAAGVSPMTVSYTYNQPTRVSAESRARVLETAAALGYAGPDPSARSLRYGSTRTLGVVLGEHLTYAFDDPQAVRFLAGVSEVCADRGYGLLIVPTNTGDEDRERVLSAAVDAYVIWTTTADDPVLSAALTTRRPVVVHSGPDVPGTTVIGIDNRAAAKAVALELFTGAHNPAVLSFPIDRRRETFISRGVNPDDVPYPVTRDRLAGYRDAAEALGIPWSKIPVGVCRSNTEADVHPVVEALMTTTPTPDAIAAMSDQLALTALSTTPTPIRITGWDDSPQAAAQGLTTISQSLREQGAACAATALGTPSPTHQPTWTLIRRPSTTHSPQPKD